MLGKRYEFDGKPAIKLNSLQENIKLQIASKIEDGRYRMEKVPCAVCEGSNFKHLSEKDRFGIRLSVVICRDCGLIQTNPRMDRASYEEFYRTEYSRLDLGCEKATKEFFLDRYFHGQSIYRFLGNYLSKDAKETFIFEVGCSSGGILAYFRDQGFQVAGIDLDKEYVRFGAENYGLDLRAGSLAECRLEKKPDIIIMSHIVEHLLKPVEEMSLIRSIIAPGGLVYIEVPGIYNLSPYNQYEMDFLKYLRLAHTYHFSLVTLRNLLNKSGFEMSKGGQEIRSIFKPDEKTSMYRDEYKKTISHLRRVETLRRYLPIMPYRIRYAIESACCWLLYRTGLYNGARGIYRRIIKRTEPKDGS